MWVPAITLAVMLPEIRASYQRIIDSMLGAFIGAGIAWALIEVLQNPSLIHLAIFIIAFLMPTQLSRRFWLHTGLLAAMVMLLYDLAEIRQGFDQHLLLERLEDMLLGCGIALVGTALAFRRRLVI
jgi:uncharacterized membrane protein YccC